LKISTIIEAQQTGWWIFKGHIPAIIAFVIFIIAVTAETNRAPFDLAEAENELTGGFHTEYSGMKFALFFLAEYVNIFVVCAIGATLFLGGWMPLHFGNWEGFNHIMDFIPSSVWFFGKTFFLIFVIMWFRWTFPRLRIDQLLQLEWKYFYQSACSIFCSQQWLQLVDGIFKKITMGLGTYINDVYSGVKSLANWHESDGSPFSPPPQG
jgi:NADH-quinone oxidoreductase subunit H